MSLLSVSSLFLSPLPLTLSFPSISPLFPLFLSFPFRMFDILTLSLCLFLHLSFCLSYLSLSLALHLPVDHFIEIVFIARTTIFAIIA
jgi:hypothetical protein